jgi:hypothetical protein
MGMFIMHKVIHNNKVIDFVKSLKYIKISKSGFVSITDRVLAQGILGSDDETVYCFEPVPGKDYLVVTIEEASSDNFETQGGTSGPTFDIIEDELVLEEARQNKIDALSAICRDKIAGGFSVKLSDKNTYVFELTTEDHLDLIILENQLASGESYFVYHAKDKSCQVYSREDMARIIKAFKAYRLYHTTYFNTAKQYIKSLTDVEAINAFTYGTSVSDFTSNPIIKQILNNGGAY